jgi:hypothetical protein
MRFNTRLFFILWIAGIIGVLSFLLVDVDALVGSLPIPAGTEIPEFTPTLKVLSLIQPTVLLAVATLVGVLLASRVGLSSPCAEALANGGDTVAALRPQITPGIIGGLVGGIAVILVGFAARQFLPTEMTQRIGEFGKFLPLATRLLYGGFAEELLLRWGVMTFLVWRRGGFFRKERRVRKLRSLFSRY